MTVLNIPKILKDKLSEEYAIPLVNLSNKIKEKNLGFSEEKYKRSLVELYTYKMNFKEKIKNVKADLEQKIANLKVEPIEKIVILKLILFNGCVSFRLVK